MFLQRDLGTSVPMRLYTMTKCYLVVVTIVFLLIIGVSVIFGVSGPNVSHRFVIPASNTDSESTSYHVDSPPLSVFHRELWLSAVVNRAPLEQDAKLSVNINTSIKVHIPSDLTAVSNVNKAVESIPSSGNSVIQLGPIHNRTIQINCPEIKCDEVFLFHLIPIDFTIYKFSISFYRESSTSSKYKEDNLKKNAFKIISVDFIFQCYTTKFTYFELIVKFLSFIISEVICILFYVNMRKFRLCNWTIEQCCIAILLPLLILYNNPLYPLQYLTTNWFPPCLGYFFQVTFICTLLLAWLCIFHGIRVSNRTFHKFYLPKVCFIGSFWLIIVLIITWKTYVAYYEPMFDILEYTQLLIFTVVSVILFGLIYVILFTVLFIRACHKLRKLPYFNLRLYFLTFQSVIFVSVLTIVLLLHLSQKFTTQILHYTDDSSLQQSQSQSQTQQQLNHKNLLGFHLLNDIFAYHSTLEFVIIQFTINAYIFLLVFVYSPPNNVQLEIDVKDDPSLSMINDSDEDVIYESDTETKTFLFSQRRL
ncbi:unnamed protein product [Trichobilharzia szidati]|nr:unnamed protein product [Trichobilharzia szidati]